MKNFNISQKIKSIRIASRSSALALSQANSIKKIIQSHLPLCNVSIVRVSTSGDKDKSQQAFSKLPIGIFVKQVEEALLTDRADIAVHSLKDLPSADTDKLSVIAFVKRKHQHDLLISKKNNPLKTLKKGSVIGTGSLRRKAQILIARPDFKVIPIRGNVPSRIKLVTDNKIDGVVLARAGILRLHLEKLIPHETLSLKNFPPAAGQGTLAIQALSKNYRWLKPLIKLLNDESTQIKSIAERECMKQLQAGCRVPVAVHAKVRLQKLILRASVYTPHYQEISITCEDTLTNPKKLGSLVAKRLLELGTKQILDAWRNVQHA